MFLTLLRFAKLFLLFVDVFFFWLFNEFFSSAGALPLGLIGFNFFFGFVVEELSLTAAVESWGLLFVASDGFSAGLFSWDLSTGGLLFVLLLVLFALSFEEELFFLYYFL